MHEIYNFVLSYFLTISPTICQIKSLSLNFFLLQKNYFFTIFSYPFLFFTKQIKFYGADYGLSSNLVTMFFKVKQLWNFRKCYSNSAIFNLFWDECWFNYKQKATYSKRKGVVITSFFLWKLFLTVYDFFENFLLGFKNLLSNPICGLLWLLSYWESINSHL